MFFSLTQAFELTSGVISKGRDTVRSSEQKRVSPIIKEIISKHSNERPKRSYGYVGLGGDRWYRFNRDLEIEGVNTGTKTYLGNWPVTRWPHLQVPPEISFAPGMRKNEKIGFNPLNPSTGCLTPTPLRYGDFEGDGSKEIILIFDDELVVFSPEYERTIFSMFIDVSDWWPYGESFFLKSYRELREGEKPDETLLYHGYSHSWADRAESGNFQPGVRVYSKLFTGDFDEDGNPDVIKWEKVYRSNKKTASIAWNKLRNSLTHYERDLDAQKITKEGVTGEYLPQITTDVIIEQWMRDKDLTWQKGYPSLSECEGKEGQLIPEMHDLLLNDPDVLK